MPRKSKKPVRKQTHSPTGKVVGQVGQILLPMIAGLAATKADLTQWVYAQGLTALHLLLREDAEEIAGLKGKHEAVPTPLVQPLLPLPRPRGRGRPPKAGGCGGFSKDGLPPLLPLPQGEGRGEGGCGQMR